MGPASQRLPSDPLCPLADLGSIYLEDQGRLQPPAFAVYMASGKFSPSGPQCSYL